MPCRKGAIQMPAWMDLIETTTGAPSLAVAPTMKRFAAYIGCMRAAAVRYRHTRRACMHVSALLLRARGQRMRGGVLTRSRMGGELPRLSGGSRGSDCVPHF
jgi:hypothetical protein